jgi:hypothetical protein
MTWILGSAVPFGYGALISDVRVSWPNGNTLDRLQKIHPVGPGLIAGCSGSVAIGFWMIYLMQRQWGRPDPGTLYPVMYMAWHWHRFAKWFYREKVDPIFHQYGCELFIAGVSPKGGGPFGLISHAVSMKAPEFTLNIVKPWTWGSIGSGAYHPDAPHFENVDSYMNVFVHGEIGNPGGTALMVAHSVANSLENQPLASVSPIIQVGITRGNGTQLRSLRREHQGAYILQAEYDLPQGELLTSWHEFKSASAASGLDAHAATT